jgi:hypothetical protein
MCTVAVQPCFWFYSLGSACLSFIWVDLFLCHGGLSGYVFLDLGSMGHLFFCMVYVLVYVILWVAYVKCILKFRAGRFRFAWDGSAPGSETCHAPRRLFTKQRPTSPINRRFLSSPSLFFFSFVACNLSVTSTLVLGFPCTGITTVHSATAFFC